LAGVRRQEYVRRRRAEWDDEPPADDVRVVDVRPHGAFSGWLWDARRQAWVEFVDGVPVREVPR
jgi:hypothetical protein